jgi:hypothetical protein
LHTKRPEDTTPRWRINLWTASATAGTAVAVAYIAQGTLAAVGYPGIPAWIRGLMMVTLICAVLVPAFELVLRQTATQFTGAVLNRLGTLTAEVAGLRTEVAGLRAVVDLGADNVLAARRDIAAVAERVDTLDGRVAEALDAEYLRGTQAAIDDASTGVASIHTRRNFSGKPLEHRSSI